MTVSFERFNSVYQDCVTEVMGYYTPDMQDEMCRHNVAWSAGRTDFEHYLRRSALRFYPLCVSLETRGAKSVCDVGGFWGVLPLTLKSLGLPSVGMTEALAYYGSAFQPLFQFLEGSGVRVHDFDPFGSHGWNNSRFDFVSMMAVLEHYPHSLQGLMATVDGMIEPGGHLYIEVPNITYLPKRLAMLGGHSPLVGIEDIYHSETPFIGHHHEFTERELVTLCAMSGYSAEQTTAYNYSTDRRINLSHGPRAFVESVGSFLTVAPYALWPGVRECVSGVFSRAEEGHVGCGTSKVSARVKLGFANLEAAVLA